MGHKGPLEIFTSSLRRKDCTTVQLLTEMLGMQALNVFEAARERRLETRGMKWKDEHSLSYRLNCVT
ncbi:MAG: hypothetical protein F6K39_01485 [Okeania sp. SIO3B3]|nr:hypothetical protein [Okeania sp. SIO3B3]